MRKNNRHRHSMTINQKLNRNSHEIFKNSRDKAHKNQRIFTRFFCIFKRNIAKIGADPSLSVEKALKIFFFIGFKRGGHDFLGHALYCLEVKKCFS
jgi:hypothetical protein